MAYRDDAESLKREVERMMAELAALRSERWQKLAALARRRLRDAAVIVGCLVVVALMDAWFGTCSNGPCKAVARREAMDFVERTRGLAPGTSTVYCAHAGGSSYYCFVTPRNGSTVRVRCEVNATWDVDGCRPHGE